MKPATLARMPHDTFTDTGDPAPSGIISTVRQQAQTLALKATTQLREIDRALHTLQDAIIDLWIAHEQRTATFRAFDPRRKNTDAWQVLLCKDMHAELEEERRRYRATLAKLELSVLEIIRQTEARGVRTEAEPEVEGGL